MRLQDGSLSGDAEIKNVHVIFMKLRAFLYSYAYVNIDQRTFFDFDAATGMEDKLLIFLHMQHPQGRPPLTFYLNAWDATARVFQKGVRSGKTLTELCAADSGWQHLWNNYVPEQPQTRALTIYAEGSDHADNEQGTRGRKGGNKDRRSSGQPDRVAAVQQAKDKQIANLKRELAQERSGGHSGGSSKGGGKGAKKWNKKW